MLYDDLGAVERAALGEGHYKSLCRNRSYILDNLNPMVQLREYQQEAIGRYLYFMEDYKVKKHPTHLLFNMATGSGKTIIMAALIIDLYKKGYRNFVFFTRLGNIVEKTKLNFLISESNKYLFNKKILIDGGFVRINQVSSFDGTNPTDINIVFTTTADLHYRLNNPSENSITFEGLQTKKIVLIADEAHNLSADTSKRLSAEDELNKKSWESTVMRILSQNKTENILLEFTATARLESDHPEILEKYQDKAIYRYDLRQYRLDGYSKDVNTFEVDAPLMERVLSAIIISQYRLKVAEHHKLQLKPVVLFKANRVTIPIQMSKSSNPDEAIVVSGIFKADFHAFISKLKPKDIAKIYKIKDNLLNRAFEFFSKNGISFEQIVSELKNDFAEINCLTVDDGQPFESKQIMLNTLEDPNNNIRAVFATQKLNEGWDVLNLFDIVRLYNSRDADNNKAGTSTVEEAQLIGRGARYFPFEYGLGNDKMRRKFDSDISNELRILEELHYHSKTNSRYIQELKSVLTETGIIPERTVNEKIFVKEEFRKTDLWLTGKLYINSREKTWNGDILSLKEARISFDESQPLNFFNLPTRAVRETALFSGTTMEASANLAVTKKFRLSDLGSHVVRTALWDIRAGSFAEIQRLFGNLDSLSKFLDDREYLGGLEVNVTGTQVQIDNLDQNEKRQIARFVIEKVLGAAHEEEVQYKGSTTFTPKTLREIFGVEKDLKLEVGSERSKKVSGYELALENWFAQNEIWGTSEEKNFLNFIRNSIQELESKFTDIVLFRNERHFPLYAFDNGEPFFPDFVLFMKPKLEGNQLGYQVFIEPKGDQFLDEENRFEKSGEGWKQKFLMQISSESNLVIDGDTHRLVGLPFFNSGITNPQLHTDFNEAFKLLSSQ
jgi:type III restriction enzyme